jgi:hypothetical protein
VRTILEDSSRLMTNNSLVGPFSGLVRKAILKQVKTEAESTFTEAS